MFLRASLLVAVLGLAGCGVFTDAATRLADSAGGASQGGNGPAARVGIRVAGARCGRPFPSPARLSSPCGRSGISGECEGPYTVQLDTAGALVFWCRNDHGEVVASPGTSYHRRFVETPDTYYLHKEAGEALVIELERRGEKAVIVGVH